MQKVINQRWIKGALALALTCTAIGCSETLKAHSSLLTRLKNRGPVALSSDNPFLAANLLIAKEMEASPELKGFIEHRGRPSAVAIEYEMFGTLMMTLYYPGDKQTYLLEDSDGTWLIRGPYALKDPELSQVLSSVGGNRGIPELLPMASPTPTNVVTNAAINATVAPQTLGFKSPADILLASPTAQVNVSDQQAISQLILGHEKDLAELSPKGDLVHYVTFPGETIISLSRWYTFDAGNSSKIARINAQKESKALSLGETIIIPSYLLKNKIRLSEEGLRRLSQ